MLSNCIPHCLLAALQLWFSHVLRDAFAAQAAGLFRPFKDVGAYHLEVMLRQAGKDARCVRPVRQAGAPDDSLQHAPVLTLSPVEQPDPAAAASLPARHSPPHSRQHVANMTPTG